MHKELRPEQIDTLIGTPAVNDEFSRKIRELDRRLQVNGMQYRDWDTFNDRQHEVFTDNLFLDGECASTAEHYVKGAVKACGCPDTEEELHHHSPVLMREIEKQEDMLPDIKVKIGESLNNLNDMIDLMVEGLLIEASAPDPCKTCRELVGNTGIRFEWVVMARLIDRFGSTFIPAGDATAAKDKLTCARNCSYSNKNYGQAMADAAITKMVQSGFVDVEAGDLSEIKEAIDVPGTEIKTDFEIVPKDMRVSLKMAKVVQGSSRRGIGALEDFKDALPSYSASKRKALEDIVDDAERTQELEINRKMIKSLRDRINRLIRKVRAVAYDPDAEGKLTKMRQFVGKKAKSAYEDVHETATTSAKEKLQAAKDGDKKAPSWAQAAAGGDDAQQDAAIEAVVQKCLRHAYLTQGLFAGVNVIDADYSWQNFWLNEKGRLDVPLRKLSEIDPEFMGHFIDNTLTGRDRFEGLAAKAEKAGDKELAEKYRRGVANFLMSPDGFYDMRPDSPERESNLEKMAPGFSPRISKKASTLGTAGTLSIRVDINPADFKKAEEVGMVMDDGAKAALQSAASEIPTTEETIEQLTPADLGIPLGPDVTPPEAEPEVDPAPANRDDDDAVMKVEKKVKDMLDGGKLEQEMLSLLQQITTE